MVLPRYLTKTCILQHILANLIGKNRPVSGTLMVICNVRIQPFLPLKIVHYQIVMVVVVVKFEYKVNLVSRLTIIDNIYSIGNICDVYSEKFYCRLL